MSHLKDCLVLDSWIEASELGGSHSDDDLVKRLSSASFQLPPNGMPFPIGQIPLQNHSAKKVKRILPLTPYT